MRKIIQISGDKALCDDGVVFQYYQASLKRIGTISPSGKVYCIDAQPEKWTRLIDIPQDEVKDVTEKDLS